MKLFPSQPNVHEVQSTEKICFPSESKHFLSLLAARKKTYKAASAQSKFLGPKRKSSTSLSLNKLKLYTTRIEKEFSHVVSVHSCRFVNAVVLQRNNHNHFEAFLSDFLKISVFKSEKLFYYLVRRVAYKLRD